MSYSWTSYTLPERYLQESDFRTMANNSCYVEQELHKKSWFKFSSDYPSKIEQRLNCLNGQSTNPSVIFDLLMFITEEIKICNAWSKPKLETLEYDTSEYALCYSAMDYKPNGAIYNKKNKKAVFERWVRWFNLNHSIINNEIPITTGVEDVNGEKIKLSDGSYLLCHTTEFFKDS